MNKLNYELVAIYQQLVNSELQEQKLQDQLVRSGSPVSYLT
ncbi:hypothetical protein [Fischerella sp. PCC 9605]